MAGNTLEEVSTFNPQQTRLLLMKTCLFLGCLALSSAVAVEFPISSGAVTYQQGAPYQIDNSLNSNTEGWAVYVGPAGPGGQFETQSAVFTLAAPVTSSVLVARMAQRLGGAHYFQRFRLSWTTAAVPDFASVWTELVPTQLSATDGIGLTNAGSNIVQIAGASASGQATFLVGSEGSFTGVTGILLEVFPVDYDVTDGLPATLGRSPNGNFVLSYFGLSDEVNWALQQPVTASAATYPGLPPASINDGRTDTISHPADPPAQDGFSYTIDLGKNIVLSRLELVERANCCPERLSNYRVQVLDYGQVPIWEADLHTDGSNAGFGGVDTIVAADGAGVFTGRYLRVQNISGLSYNPQVAEFRAFGTPLVEINWALNRPVTAGATYPGYPANLINDGNAGTNSFSHPDAGAEVGFSYTIDLGQSIDLSRLELVGRNDCCPDRLSNYRVTVLDDSLTPVWLGDAHTDGTNAGLGGIDFMVPSSGLGTFSGRYLQVENISGTPYSPQVAEFRAFGIPSPPFRIRRFILGAGGNSYTLSFDSVEGIQYRIEYSEDLTTWYPIAGEVTGAGEITTVNGPFNLVELPNLSEPHPKKVFFHVVRVPFPLGA